MAQEDYRRSYEMPRGAKTRYTRNKEKWFRRDNDERFPGHYVCPRSETNDGGDHRHNLATITDVPYLVKSVDIDAKTFPIGQKDETVETLSRSCVTVSPHQLWADELQENTHLKIINESIRDYPVSELP